jgi:hypothetical protein
MPQYMTRFELRLRTKGGGGFNPEVVLLAGTPLSIMGLVHPKRDGFGKSAENWYSVLIEGGPHKDKTGFLQTTWIADYVPLSGVPLLNCADGTVTRYGMAAKAVRVGDGVEIISPWDGRCRLCGEASALHILPSATNGPKATAARAATLLAGINNTIRTNKKFTSSICYLKTKEIMIGVLMVADADVIYASHSGQKADDAFAQVCKQLNYEYAAPVNGTEILNRRGEKVNDTKIQSFDYQCAAPRLIQAAIRDKHYPVTMTEIYGGGGSEGTVIPSCGRCKLTVPFMLCPE